jgi:GNAT superfamily N-acetyltransferase
MSSPPAIQIRPIQASDKETWKNLWAQYNAFYKRTIADDVTEVTFDRFLDAQNPICCAVAVADSDSQPIGFATYYPHPSTASIDPNFYLHDLFVDPASRAGGTGEMLIDYVADKAREAGAYQLYWHTQVWCCSLPRDFLSCTDIEAVFQLPCSRIVCQGWREIGLGALEEGVVGVGTWSTGGSRSIGDVKGLFG